MIYSGPLLQLPGFNWFWHCAYRNKSDATTLERRFSFVLFCFALAFRTVVDVSVLSSEDRTKRDIKKDKNTRRPDWTEKDRT